jgi:hypothetical protein
MLRNRAITAVAAIGLLLTSAQVQARINQAGNLPAPTCANNICTIAFQFGDLAYTDGNNNVATKLGGVTVSIIQSSAVTNWVASFDLYNVTHDQVTLQEPGTGHLFIRFKDSFGNYLSDTIDISFDRTGCLEQGKRTPAGVVQDIFKAGATTFELSQKTVTAPIGVC